MAESGGKTAPQIPSSASKRCSSSASWSKRETGQFYKSAACFETSRACWAAAESPSGHGEGSCAPPSRGKHELSLCLQRTGRHHCHRRTPVCVSRPAWITWHCECPTQEKEEEFSQSEEGLSCSNNMNFTCEDFFKGYDSVWSTFLYTKYQNDLYNLLFSKTRTCSVPVNISVVFGFVSSKGSWLGITYCSFLCLQIFNRML